MYYSLVGKSDKIRSLRVNNCNNCLYKLTGLTHGHGRLEKCFEFEITEINICGAPLLLDKIALRLFCYQENMSETLITYNTCKIYSVRRKGALVVGNKIYQLICWLLELKNVNYATS